MKTITFLLLLFQITSLNAQSISETKLICRTWQVDFNELRRQEETKSDTFNLFYNDDTRNLRWGFRLDRNGNFHEFMAMRCDLGRKPDNGTWLLQGDTLTLNGSSRLLRFKILYLTEKYLRVKLLQTN